MNTFRSKHAVLRFAVIAGSIIGTLWAQDSLPKPATHVQLVRVRIELSCGWCTEGYNDIETVVEPQRNVSINRAYSNKKKYPDLVSESKITKRDWKDLQDLIEARVLAVFAEPRASSCPGCADEATASTELQFSDGSKKSVVFNGDGEPAPILELRQKIGEIGKRAWLNGTRSPAH